MCTSAVCLVQSQLYNGIEKQVFPFYPLNAEKRKTLHMKNKKIKIISALDKIAAKS
jgi:hypothetical protein